MNNSVNTSIRISTVYCGNFKANILLILRISSQPNCRANNYYKCLIRTYNSKIYHKKVQNAASSKKFTLKISHCVTVIHLAKLVALCNMVILNI